MADDWIKMRTDLYRDPKVVMMADFLMASDGELARFVNQNLQRDMAVTRNVMRNVTVGALVSVWGVLRHRGKRKNDDLIVSGGCLAVIDDIADIPGFGSAMSSVGWAVEHDNVVVFPRFFEDFNIEPSEESKQKNADRQRRHREKEKEKRNALRNVTITSQSNGREEKSIVGSSSGESPLLVTLENVQKQHLSSVAALCGIHRSLNREFPNLYPSDGPTLAMLVGAAEVANAKAKNPVDYFCGIVRKRNWKWPNGDLKKLASRRIQEHLSWIETERAAGREPAEHLLPMTNGQSSPPTTSTPKSA